MGVTVQEEHGGKVLIVKGSGKLLRKDYEQFVPRIDKAIKEHGTIRIQFQMEDFHGWTPGALWEDVKFDLRHFRDVERLALVGDKRWEQMMAAFCKPFTSAKIRYFDHAEIDKAHEWIAADLVLVENPGLMVESATLPPV